MTRSADCTAARLRSLVGARLVEVGIADLAGLDVPTLRFADGDREVVVLLLSDEEGNGPGAAEVVEIGGDLLVVYALADEEEAGAPVP